MTALPTSPNMPNLLDDVEQRARAAVPARDTTWAQAYLSPDAIVFHTPEQLRLFVRAEILRAYELSQVPTSEFVEDMRAGRHVWPPRLRYTDDFSGDLKKGPAGGE